MLVKRTMSKNVVSVSVPGNREKVLDLMRKEKKAVLPVVKEDTNILVGLVTRSDLINNPDEEQIAMLMSRDLITVHPSDDVVDAARVMMENNVRRVPVVNDDGELVGIITSFDLVSKALTKIEIYDAVEDYMITAVPTTWEKAPLNVAFESMNQFGLKSILAAPVHLQPDKGHLRSEEYAFPFSHLRNCISISIYPFHPPQTLSAPHIFYLHAPKHAYVRYFAWIP